MELTVFLCR